MPDSKITALTALTAADPANDMFPVVDVSDTTMAASGTTKRISINNILACSPSATLASATITGALGAAGLNVTGATIPANGVYLGSANNLSFSAASALGMTLNSTGLGVGVAPVYKLQSVGIAAATSSAFNGSGGNLIGALLNSDDANSGANPGVDLRRWTGTAFNHGTSYIATNSAGDTLFYNGAVASNTRATSLKMTLDATGNVGIGVTPSAWGGAFKAVDFGTVGGMAATGVATRFTHNSYNNGTNFIYKASSVAACLYELNAGEHRWFTAPSGTAGNSITFTQAMTLDASGNLLVGLTTANANGGVLQLKSGITFPATQVASSDANTLDDYEEGTWTATLNVGTFSSQVFKYTKIGNMVTVFFDVVVGTGGGNQITNLPYTAAGTVANGIYTNAQNYAAGTTSPVVVVGGSSAVMYFRTVGNNVAFSTMTLTAGAALSGSISYYV